MTEFHVKIRILLFVKLSTFSVSCLIIWQLSRCTIPCYCSCSASRWWRNFGV